MFFAQSFWQHRLETNHCPYLSGGLDCYARAREGNQLYLSKHILHLHRIERDLQNAATARKLCLLLQMP